ncbi:MAG: hypothetical protein K2M06_00110, partial [Muribaculaceae bacterium]|nr:hypothetical protein [Muribaculaceae bacterium]
YTLCMSNEFSSITPLGDGTFVENIIYPIFADGAENKKALSVTVRQLDDHIISVLDPFRATFELKGYTSKSPSMILDITDPANVLVQMQSTGLGNTEDGTLYYFSDSWYYMQNQITNEPYIPVVMFREGADVRISFPENSMSLYGGVSQKFYTASPFESVLKFTMEDAGVGNIATEEASGAVEYYTLQGLRVENPGRGMVIRVSGGKASKILIK